MKARLVGAALALALLAGAGVAAARSSGGSSSPAGPVVRHVTIGGHPITVVVAPGRPGRNVVEAFSPHGVPVEGTGPVDLPVGRSTIHLGVGPRTRGISVRVSGPTSTWADDECASRLLGLVLAHRPAAGCAPPPTGDAAAVAAALVRQAADTHISAVALRADDTPRGRAALAGASAEAGRRGVRLRPLDGPAEADEAVLLLDGWGDARAVVATARPGRGFLVAPWLLEPGVLTAGAISSAQLIVATELSPTSARANAYLSALAAAVPGAAPTASGLAAFAGTPAVTSLQLWAPANIQFLPRALSAGHTHAVHGPSWTPDGSLALVRTALPL